MVLFNIVSPVFTLVLLNSSNFDSRYKFIRKFALFVKASYYNSSLLKSWNCKYCIEETKGIKVTRILQNNQFKAHGYIGYHKKFKIIVASFRGTKTKENRMQNLKIKLIIPDFFRSYSDLKVHLGFSQIANSLYQDTENELIYLIKQNPTFKVLFTGHILGGAMAALNLVRMVSLKKLNQDDVKLYTFGHSKVGNGEFIRLFNELINPKRVFRVVLKGDIVPNVFRKL